MMAHQMLLCYLGPQAVMLRYVRSVVEAGSNSLVSVGR
jgi:hypothetical protein